MRAREHLSQLKAPAEWMLEATRSQLEKLEALLARSPLRYPNVA